MPVFDSITYTFSENSNDGRETLLEVKFVYSEKATKFCEISTLLLSTVHTDKIKGEISQNFVKCLHFFDSTTFYGLHRTEIFSLAFCEI